MIIVDGSFGEGGGSILRQSICLSLIYNKPFRIINIRKNRSKQGLSHQHLKALELARDLTGSKATGLFIGSGEVEFFPRSKFKSSIEIDVKTAGSVTLVLQSVFLPCLLSGKPITITLKGGTDVPFSPGVDYFSNVFLSFFREYGVKFEVLNRGYYPKGGGVVKIYFKKTSFTKITLDYFDRGEFVSCYSISHCSKSLSSLNICEEQSMLSNILIDKNISFKNYYSDSLSDDHGLLLYANYTNYRVGIDVVSANKLSVDKLTRNVCKRFDKLLSEEGLDPFMSDQIIPYLAICKGKILCSEITDHVRSNVYVANLFSNSKIKIEKKVITAL